jgi:DNA-directed RNA polymerase specialized sigma24 family protein
MTDDDFPQLLAGAQAGDDDAVRALYTDLHPRLLRFLVATEPRAAEDLAAEVWLGVAQGPRSRSSASSTRWTANGWRSGGSTERPPPN